MIILVANKALESSSNEEGSMVGDRWPEFSTEGKPVEEEEDYILERVWIVMFTLMPLHLLIKKTR